MNHTTRLATLLLALTLLPLTLVGCGEARQQAESQRALDEALDQLESASAGFVPAGQPEGTTYKDYRLDQLAEAVAPLETALASPDPTVKAAAAQLLADVRTAQARRAGKEAVDRAAALSSRSVTVVSLLLAADAARNQSQAYASDSSGVIKLLDDQVKQFNQVQQQLQAQLKELRDESEQLANQQQQLADQRQKLLDQARAKREQAFTATGSEAVDQYAAAAEIEQKASNLQAQMRRLESRQAAADNRIETLDTQVSAIDNARQKLTQRVTDTRTVADNRKQLSQAATQQRDDNVTTLTGELNAIAGTFTSEVQPLFTQARAHAAAAVEALQTAVGPAPARLKDDLKLQLVGAMTQQLDIMAAEHQALAGYADTFELAANNAPRIAPNRAAAISEAFAKVRTIRDQIQSEATAIINQARTLAGELDSSNADIAELAAERRSDLDRYARTLNPA